MLKLFNTLGREVQNFIPLKNTSVGLYSCGPTVYNYVHIGNLRAYIFADILKRVLEYNDYTVNHVMNITDVGHLTDDADSGEDKMEKGSKREGKTAWELADFYTKSFLGDIQSVNIKMPNIMPVATEHIQEQIDQVQKLIDGGYTYETKDGIYFDTTKIDDYGKLALLEKQDLRAGERVEMGEKKNLHDFALWKFNKPGEERQMQWEAFGKLGFPGWHIECSAMSMKYLGDQFDIHTGGIDHVPIHHTNEIAQAESTTGKKPWVKYWLHNEFLNIGNEKMAKSGNNFITLQTLKDKGIEPLAYRYFLLQSHYRKQVNFSYKALEAAQTALNKLREHIYKNETETTKGEIEKKFLAAINDDLNTPEALALLWTTLKNKEISNETIFKFDKVFGLDLAKPQKQKEIPTEVKEILEQRQKAREQKNWAESDKLRDEIAKLGFKVEDTDEGQKII